MGLATDPAKVLKRKGKMKTDVENRFIWFKKNLVHVKDAEINVLAPTSQFGLNVFEGIPCYWNREERQLYVFRLEDHYDRLLRSARMLQIETNMKRIFPYGRLFSSTDLVPGIPPGRQICLWLPFHGEISVRNIIKRGCMCV